MNEEIINLKDYFVHHYDDWGRLYCVEFKGNPLELENSIKRLEQENNSLQAQLNNITVQSNNVITALEQENKELSKLIRGTKDYAEVCSACKDEVTIYPNISGRTDYTQNEVECRTLAQIITRENNLEQKNKELKISNSNLDNQLHRTIEMMNNCNNRLQKYRSALEEIREIAERISKSTIDTYPYGGDKKTWEAEIAEQILNKIKEVINE